MPNTTSPIVPKAEPIAQIESSSAFTSVNNGRSYPPSSSPEPEPEPPTTPAKKTLKSKKTATPKTPKGPKMPKIKTPAKRVADGAATTGSAKKVKGTPVDRKAIPTSKEELSAEDKMMLAWKDVGLHRFAFNPIDLANIDLGGQVLEHNQCRVGASHRQEARRIDPPKSLQPRQGCRLLCRRCGCRADEGFSQGGRSGHGS
jgi:hypothetical protein